MLGERTRARAWTTHATGQTHRRSERLERLSHAVASVALAAGLAACSGMIGDPSGAPGPGPGGSGSGSGIGSSKKPVCDLPQPGASPIRRLTRFEYNNTVADLLGDTTRPAAEFPGEGGSGFDNNADLSVVTRLQAEKYMLAAEAVALRATADTSKLATLLGCDIKADESGCVTQWVSAFGKRAWRRPLEPSESQAMVDLYNAARTNDDEATSVAVVLQAFLQSPFFLYRVELPPAAAGDKVVALDGYEMASRLSYLIWGSMPDDKLFAAAKAGELSNKDQVATQARRMLDDPRARRMVQHFHAQWLGYRDVDQLQKDANAYPEFDSGVAALLKQETERFVDDVFWGDSPTLQSLLTAQYTFVNAELAAFYKLPAPSGQGWQKVALSGRDASGVLTQGGLMAIYAKPSQTSPIHRGVWIREQLLCAPPPAPPDNADIRFPPPDPNVSIRERLAQHRSDPACKGCHELMDPIGFGFEHFDGVGRYRQNDDGRAVDASGKVLASDVDGPFVGAEQLGKKLAQSQQVAQCVSKQWFRFAYGRIESQDDACSLARINELFAQSGYNLRELLIALTQTDAFRYRKADQGGS